MVHKVSNKVAGDINILGLPSGEETSLYQKAARRPVFAFYCSFSYQTEIYPFPAILIEPGNEIAISAYFFARDSSRGSHSG